MRYAKIEKCECTNGLGWGVSLYVQGCSRQCKGCFNKQTWDFSGGKYFGAPEHIYISNLLAEKPEVLTRFSILGGEPLEENNLLELASVIARARITNKNLKIWLFTGYTWEELEERIKDRPDNYLSTILENIDVLVDGPFIQEQKDLTLKFAGSRNQRIIDVQRTLCQDNIVLFQ